MSNRTQLLARLRDELGDGVAPYVWSDAVLINFLNECTDWYSRFYPMQGTAYRDVITNQRTFSVPVGALGIKGIELPIGNTLPQLGQGAVGNVNTYHGGAQQGWWVWGGTIYLRNPASGNEVGLSNLAMLVLLPWDRLDPFIDWTGPDVDERLLVIWCAWQAWQWWDGKAAKLGRSNRAGARADSPQASQTMLYKDMLDAELGARQRKVSSRTLTASW